MNKVENFDQLAQNLNAWVEKEFLPTHSKAWLFYNGAKVHWMGAFIDSIENYVVNEVDDEIIQAENNFVLRWFNDGNDLFTLADLVYMDHRFGYDDHYGVNSYETLWAFAVEVLQGYYKNKENAISQELRDAAVEFENQAYEIASKHIDTKYNL